jgi:hypothetical protein
MKNDIIKRRTWISVTYFFFILTKKNFILLCVIKSQTHVETKSVACKININIELSVTLKKYICQKVKLFYILHVRILYGLFGKDQKHVITA